MSNDKIKLEPCPFCGGEADISVDSFVGHSVDYLFIGCNTDGCLGNKQKPYLFSEEQQAITAWNHRQAQGVSEADVRLLLSLVPKALKEEVPEGLDPTMYCTGDYMLDCEIKKQIDIIINKLPSPPQQEDK